MGLTWSDTTEYVPVAAEPSGEVLGYRDGKYSILRHDARRNLWLSAYTGEPAPEPEFWAYLAPPNAQTTRRRES